MGSVLVFLGGGLIMIDIVAGAVTRWLVRIMESTLSDLASSAV